MEEILVKLVTTARDENAVARRQLDNGMQLLAYPLAEGFLIALGTGRDESSIGQAQRVLNQRSQQIARFGAWLPAMLNDGSLYVVRRIQYINPKSNWPTLLSDELLAAQELFK